MAKGPSKRNADTSLAVRAAWLHYAGGITQAEVARRLRVSNATASRLIASAHDIGAVKVSIVGDVAECLGLGDDLCGRFGLKACEVVPDLNEDGLPLRALGHAGAIFLERTVQSGGEMLIGLGHGRTLAAAIDMMSRIEGGTVRFVSLLGGVTRNYAANPHDVMFRLAQKTGVESYILPVPFFANTAQDRDVLLAQRGVRHVYDLALAADIMIVGIGTAEPDAQLVSSRMIEQHEIEEVRRAGGVGELLGHFFDAGGNPIRTSLEGRTVSPDLKHLKDRRVIAIAGGPEKIDAIAAVLNSGTISELIIDEPTARDLIRKKVRKPPVGLTGSTASAGSEEDRRTNTERAVHG